MKIVRGILRELLLEQGSLVGREYVILIRDGDSVLDAKQMDVENKTSVALTDSSIKDCISIQIASGFLRAQSLRPEQRWLNQRQPDAQAPSIGHGANQMVTHFLAHAL